MSIENCFRVDMCASLKVPSHFQTFPPLFPPATGLFSTQNDSFTYFKKESSSGLAQKLLGPLETITYPAISSLFQTLSTHFSAYFPHKNYIFTYLKKESSSGSAQKLLGPLKIDPGCPMVATTTFPAISCLFRTLSTHFLAYFPPKIDIFTYFKKKSSSGSPQKLLRPLEIVPG